MKNTVVFGSLLLAAALAANAAAAQSPPPPTDVPGTEPEGFHGMLLFGHDTIYMSHLPMFTALHRYQGIWEVTFGASGDQKYRAARAQAGNAGTIFTLAPLEDFRLPDLMASRTSFKADVFIGHFEKPDPRSLLKDVTVTLVRPVHFHPFRRADRAPEALTYLVFGKGQELFLAHHIGVAPSYDQVLALSSPALGEIPKGAVITLPGRADTLPLRATESVSALLAGEGPQAAPGRAVDLRVSSEVYLEKGELKPDHLPPLP